MHLQPLPSLHDGRGCFLQEPFLSACIPMTSSRPRPSNLTESKVKQTISSFYDAFFHFSFFTFLFLLYLCTQIKRNVGRCRSVRQATNLVPAPVVQWIELRFPKPSIRVRFPAGVLLDRTNKTKSETSTGRCFALFLFPWNADGTPRLVPTLLFRFSDVHT